MGREEPQAQADRTLSHVAPEGGPGAFSAGGLGQGANLGPSLPPLGLALLVCRAHAEKKKDRSRNEGRKGRKGRREERREGGKAVKIISDRGFPGGPAVKTPH